MAEERARMPEAAGFPMAVGAFLEGGYLARADIVLMRGTSPFSRAIRLATRSPFSHAALVFLIPDPKSGFERTFLIEAVPKGVSIHGLGEVVGAGAESPKPAVAVLRLQRDWFAEDTQKLVRGRMLDFIRAGYDWRAVIGLAWSLAKGMLLGRETYVTALRRSLTESYRKRRLAPANFICSGLVQYGFLRTVHDLAESGASAIRPEDVSEVVFDERLRRLGAEAVLRGAPEARAELLATTPEEISRAPALAWKYLILDGRVHAVDSREAAVAMLAGG